MQVGSLPARLPCSPSPSRLAPPVRPTSGTLESNEVCEQRQQLQDIEGGV